TLLVLSVPPPATSPTYTLSLHDALPIFRLPSIAAGSCCGTRGLVVLVGHDPGVAVGVGCIQHVGGAHHLHLLRTAGIHDGRRHRSEEHTSELQSRENLVCRLLLEKKKTT